jgi:dethiobiotin synthetase
MTALFVTATGTDIGKTFVASGLIAQLRQKGRAVEAIKPVVTGFDPAAATASDPAILLAALGRPQADIPAISPWRFTAPLSPDLAARREGRAVDFAALVDFSQAAVASAKDVLLVEGIGGIMVPLDARNTVLDWITALRLPLILVTGSYLGTLSHTLSAVDVLARRELRIAAAVVSESVASPVPLDDTAAVIARFVQPIPVFALPRLPPGTTRHPVFEQLAELGVSRSPDAVQRAVSVPRNEL